MDVVSETAQLVEQFKQSVETAAPPFAQASRLLSDIKVRAKIANRALCIVRASPRVSTMPMPAVQVRLIQFKSLPPAGMDSPTAQREKMIARACALGRTLRVEPA